MNYFENMFSLRGKTAVLVGGGGVLGSAMACALGKAGAHLAVVCPVCDHINRLQTCANEENIMFKFYQSDASVRSETEQTAREIMEEFGRVDILVNAAGINSATPFLEISDDEWDRIMRVNLKSAFLTCQVFGRIMLDQGEGGSIINISSVSSGPPLSRVFTYSVSKAGLNNLTQNLAREWAPHKIRVNAIRPGFFPAEQNKKILDKKRTEDIFRHTPMARFGEPDELAGTILWLASEKAASYVTGAIICVDGGYTAMSI